MSDLNDKNPLVSVGLMTYNRAHDYLRGVVDSWLAQIYTNFELIISNDASMDDTDRICREYAKKDPRIRYYKQEKNLGCPACYKFILNQARGEYFIWVSDDDLWDKRFLEDCVEVFKKDPKLIMVFANMVDIDKNRAVIKELDPAKYFPSSKDTYERLKAHMLFYFDDGKLQLLFGLWKRKTVLDDPLFGPHAKNDRPPYYWGFDNYFVFRNLAKGPAGFVPHIRFFRRSRVPEEYRESCPFVPRIFVTLVHRLEKIFRSPYFLYIMKCILRIKELSPFQKLKLILWNFFVMARLFFKRKI